MLIPRRVKHRKQHHPGRTGAAKGGTKVNFGEFGIQARMVRTHEQRNRPSWTCCQHRMGSGKGAPEWWVANVKPGRVMFELSGVSEEVAREALRRAIHKLPMKCRFVKREVGDV